MSATEILRRLAALVPRSETQWRAIQSAVHRLFGKPGDEAWAKTQEQAIRDIREGVIEGDSSIVHFCPRCLDRKVRVTLLDYEQFLKCGTCGFTRTKRERGAT
jgi:hypothetical protein